MAAGVLAVSHQSNFKIEAYMVAGRLSPSIAHVPTISNIKNWAFHARYIFMLLDYSPMTIITISSNYIANNVAAGEVE